MATDTPDGQRPTTYISSIAGIVIAWDVCGSCLQSVRRCDCDEGPVEPAFLAANRGPDDPPPCGVARSASTHSGHGLAVTIPPTRAPRLTFDGALVPRIAAAG